jgi:hypothetical protein
MCRLTGCSSPLARVRCPQPIFASLHISTEFFWSSAGDPWLDATVWADDVHKQTTQTLIVAVGDGYHTSDMLTRSSVDGSIAAVQAQALAAMKRWLSEWTPPY